MKPTNLLNGVPTCLDSNLAIPASAQNSKGTSLNPEIVQQTMTNTIGLEQFDEVVISMVKVAKMEGAKSVKLNCIFTGEIIF